MSDGVPATPEGAAEAGSADEVSRLRAEVARLQSELAAQAAPVQRTAPLPPSVPLRQRWRAITSATLIVIACLLAPLSVVAVWANRTVSDTNRYVETVAPLARNPDVQAVITDQVTQQIFNAVDINGLTNQALSALGKVGLPPVVSNQLQGLSTPIANGVESFVHDQVAKIVASPAFAKAWDAANAAAHDQLIAVLSGKQGGAISTKNGVVSLNLGPFIAQVKDQLVAQGLTIASKVPNIDKSFTLVDSKSVTHAQSAYRLLNTLGTWLPIIALILAALGVYIARNHRRALIGASLGIAGSMLVLGLGLAIARVFYLRGVPSSVLPHDAAVVVFDTLVRFLRNSLRVVAVAALVVAIGAFFVGGSVTAVRSRRVLTGGIGWLRRWSESVGVKTGPVGSWVYAHKRWLLLALVGVAVAIVVLTTSQLSIGLVLTTAVLVLIGAGIIEFLSRPPERLSPS